MASEHAPQSPARARTCAYSSAHAATLPAPQPRARGKIIGRERNAWPSEKCVLTHITASWYRITEQKKSCVLTTRTRDQIYYGVLCTHVLFLGHLHPFLRRPWVFSRVLGCGARRGPRMYTTAQVWVPCGHRGAYSGRSKSRNLASHHGVAFRGASA